MSHIVKKLATCIAGALLISSVAMAQQSIMIGGDSISAGFLRPSYRQPLLDELAERGCTVDMVGNQILNSYSFRDPVQFPGEHFGSFTPANGYDVDHQAWPGITVNGFNFGQQAGGVLPIASYVAQFQPDFMVIHLGTNDLSGAVRTGTDTAAEITSWVNLTTDRLERVINNIVGAHSNPADLRLLIANFIPYSADNLNAVQTLAALRASELYTQAIERMVDKLRNPSVVIVDVENGFNLDTMTTDGVHPNAAGERHLANSILPTLLGSGLCADNQSASNGGSGNGTPELTDPSPGSNLTGSTATFNWTSNGLIVDDWYLRVGNSRGSTEYADQRFRDPSTTSFRVSNLPLDGRDIHVEHSYKLPSGEWVIRDFVYTTQNPNDGAPVDGNASGGVTLSADNSPLRTTPQLTTPAPGTTLAGSAVTFNWTSNGLVIDDWYLRVGNSTGSTEYADQRFRDPSTTSFRVSNLPLDGRDIHVEHSYKLPSGEWVIRDFIYTTQNPNDGAPVDDNASGDDAPSADNSPVETTPQLTSPVPGTSLTGSTATFNWTSNGLVIDDWYLRVGNSRGSTEYADQRFRDPSTTSFRVSNLPLDGRDIHVEHSYKLPSGTWVIRNFIYTAQNTSDGDSVDDNSSGGITFSADNSPVGTTPQLTTPAPGTTLTGSAVTFNWTSNGLVIDDWYLRVGNSRGSTEYTDQRFRDPSTTSFRVSSLPLDGRDIHVEHSYKLPSGKWVTNDYTYSTQ